MSADLTSTIQRGVGSSGMPLQDSRPAGQGTIPLQTTETTLLANTGAGNRTVNVFFCNRSGGAVSVTVYLKPLNQTTGVMPAGAAGTTICYQYALPTTGEPVTFQAFQALDVPGDSALTALLSTGANNAANAVVSGIVQR